LQTYLSALTGSIKLLELQLAAVNSTSSSLAGSVSSAFGGNAQQRDSQLDVQVTQLYQVRLVYAGLLAKAADIKCMLQACPGPLSA
jgi:hypothetical protein